MPILQKLYLGPRSLINLLQVMILTHSGGTRFHLLMPSQAFSKYLWSTYYGPGPVLGSADMATSKTDRARALMAPKVTPADI